jgi:NAD(P)-dependent dehydrogenase (short-subunit alcohol dehydrogenase family)
MEQSMRITVDLAGKTALVTGAGRGIGRAIAERLAASGATLCINDINPDHAQATVNAIRAGGGQAIEYVASVDIGMAVHAMFNTVMETWGRLDFLVNNAGVEPKGSILETREWSWNKTLAVNLTGTFLCSQAAGQMMREQETGGVIVNIASIAGHAIPLPHAAAYTASKAGIVGFTKECAREFAAYNIRVNAICPGVIITPMTEASRNDEAIVAKWLADIPQRRLGQPEEVAELALFLCSDSASYITGQAIHVDGGKSMV